MATLRKKIANSLRRLATYVETNSGPRPCDIYKDIVSKRDYDVARKQMDEEQEAKTAAHQEKYSKFSHTVWFILLMGDTWLKLNIKLGYDPAVDWGWNGDKHLEKLRRQTRFDRIYRSQHDQ